jgi:hypothetical protein
MWSRSAGQDIEIEISNHGAGEELPASGGGPASSTGTSTGTDASPSKSVKGGPKGRTRAAGKILKLKLKQPRCW